MKGGIFASKRAKRLSFSGVVIAILALLLCELPILLALLGMVGLSSAFSDLALSPTIALVSAVVGVIIFLALVSALAYRISRKERS